MESTISIIFLLLSILLLLYLLIIVKYNYWKRRAIDFIEPKIPYGNIKDIVKRLPFGILLQKFYKHFKARNQIFGGIYSILTPVALVCDLELIKLILVKDFRYFPTRPIYYNERHDPLSAHLVSLDYPKWKVLRPKLTPTFTSGKMKFMLSTVVEVGMELQNVLAECILVKSEIEMKDILSRFTMDTIGSCAFGIKCNTLRNKNTEFSNMGKKVFTRSLIRRQITSNFKTLANFLRIRHFDKSVTNFFSSVVYNTIDFREKNDIHRNDFMELLIELKNSTANEPGIERITTNEITAQALLFFLAGFETSSTAMTYALYEMAFNKSIQDRARDEITQVLSRHDGKITYEALSEMSYLDQIINESLRKYPPFVLISRVTAKDYKIPNTSYIIEKGVLVWIPCYAIHHDPDNYPNPEKFDPDRFLPENTKTRHPSTFLAFGDGPRNCIGMRFGMMQTRIGLISLLKKFRFSPSPNLKYPAKFLPGRLVLTLDENLPLIVEKI